MFIMYKCSYCKNIFDREFVLKRHQNKTKYCLDLQQNKQEKCEYCKKIFARSKMNYHLKKCPIKNKISNTTTNTTNVVNATSVIANETEASHLAEIFKRILDKLDDRPVERIVSNIQERPTVVQNMEPLTVASIHAMALEYLDIDDIEKGIQGIIDFTIKYPLQGKVVCTDKSRKKFRYTDERGNIVDDFGGAKLSQTVFEGIKDRCTELIDHKYSILTLDIQNAVEQNKGGDDIVLSQMRKSVTLQTIKSDLNEASQGIENDMQKKYIRGLVKGAELL